MESPVIISIASLEEALEESSFYTANEPCYTNVSILEKDDNSFEFRRAESNEI
jgi:hypothetical protein